jgi:nucleoside-diphosphate-sugar epimerase
MKVFVTGASGFIGSAVVKELLAAGHAVVGLARSAESAKAIIDAGAEALAGNLDDLDVLRQGAAQADGVIHTAFVHDFSQYMKAAATDKAAIEAMGEVLAGTDKPIVVTGGVLGVATTNGFATEAEAALPSSPRASESAAMALAAAGIRASIVRLPPCVHGFDGKVFKAGFGSVLIHVAKLKGVSAYIGEGTNRWSAVHRLDAAKLFRLALEKAGRGARYHCIGDEAIPLKEIAEVIGQKLQVPVKSITPEEAMVHFDVMGRFFVLDGAATSHLTQEQLSWKATHVGLLEDIAQQESIG